ALKVAQKAGIGLLELYQKPGPFAVSTKQDASPLTDADILAHEIIKVGLIEITPTIPVLSEEDCHIPFQERREWPYYWLVDPLDGTREFIHRSDEFTVNIALIHKGHPILGIIYLPVANISFFACQGQKAFKQEANHPPQPIHIRRRTSSENIVVVIGPRSKTTRLQEILPKHHQYEILRLGSALKFCWIAEGKADIYPCLGAPYEWDTAAGLCIIEAAGGQIIDLQRLKPLQYNAKESLVSPPFIAVGDNQLLTQFNLPPIIQTSETKHERY
ncbi:MAG: 3'(2'),5'-bisphosphate nucleotidase CysQ, partial [Gammaproteobacteria bacterium]